MNIAIVGSGYVGLVSGTCFSEMGIDVTCVDTDASKIGRLQRGEIPIYEPGLESMVRRNVAAGRLHFTTELASCIDRVDVVFSAVGTPSSEDGSADLKHVFAVAETFGRCINRYTLLVMKSTVPVGTTHRVGSIVKAELEKRGADIGFDVVSNPEFLKEGAAIKDFMSPDRIVIGVESERAKGVMTRLYRPFLVNDFRCYFMDIPSAEMTKYAANAMLATRISFMNDIANLIKIAEDNGYRMRVLQAVDEVNESQKSILFDKLSAYYDNDLQGRTIAMWGLSFKPETDDMREAPSLVLIERLAAAGCRIKVYDPIAMDECRRRFGDMLVYCGDMYEAAVDADALLLVTEWKELRMPSWPVLARVMKRKAVFDGRNIYDRHEAENAGFDYYKIG